ncbi:type VI secretion system contractile sheath large subunit [Teredinibacter turnerae]|uniref:type VI secretion system contractile sheath large subunit n=1 Tax=Teredinibacter turnerae TaxID=2426 RepID=UPI00059FBC83|nr:type VI secretion system contractile sheath large subunit [Teredinibacter turnerae]
MLTSDFAEESADRTATTTSVVGTLTTLDKFLASPASFDSLVSFVNTYFIEPPATAEELYCEIDQIIASIDELVISQLNAILHHPNFQKIEASWRGLWYLVVQAEGVRNLKIKLLNANWLEVTKDIERALDFDQSQLYQKIYSEEYGTPGGEPYGVIIGDYDIHHKPNAQHPDDISTLDGLADIGSAAFTPFILGASPQLLGSNNFTELGQGSRLGDVFSQSEYIRWRSLREKPEARFVGLTLPRILMRTPYRKTTGSYKGLRFRELPGNANQEAYLWGNAAYAFGGILIREFAAVGWFGHIRGVPRDLLGGGLVTNLPMDSFDTDKTGVAFKPATDILITDALEREISELGMVPLCHCYNTPFAAFYSNQSVQSVNRASNSTTAINYKLSTMLQHVLCASRVAHYIKVMIRDKVGSFLSAEECQVYLGTWLRRYTTGRHDLEWEQQARYPLREANVTVREHPEKPGQYLCVIHLVPHYQIDQMVSELELVTELVQSN